MPSFQEKNKPLICDLKDTFGAYVDYFLYGVTSQVNFQQAMDFFIRNFHANMTPIEDFSIEGHALNAQFPMAYSLFKMRGCSEDKPEGIMDFLSIVLFQNRAAFFDKPQIKDTNGTLDMFSDESADESENAVCYALNKYGYCLQKWSLTDIDYLVFISSKKNRDASLFADFFTTFSIPMVNLTHFIRGDQQSLASSKIQSQINFVRQISNYAQREISKDLDYSDLCSHRRNIAHN